MKSREGTVVDADDPIDTMSCFRPRDFGGQVQDMDEKEASEVARMVGLGALKYFLPQGGPAGRTCCSIRKESIDFNGNTGPFIQYTYARIRSVIRKAEGFDPLARIEGEPNEKESTLIRKVADFRNVVREAGDNCSPAIVANYAYDLAKEYKPVLP